MKDIKAKEIKQGKKHQKIYFAKHVPTLISVVSTSKPALQSSFMKVTYTDKVKTFIGITIIESKTKTPSKVNVSFSIAKAKFNVITSLSQNENLKKVKLFNLKFELNYYFVPSCHIVVN